MLYKLKSNASSNASGSEPAGNSLPGADQKIHPMLCKLKSSVIRKCEESESISVATVIRFHNLESLVYVTTIR